jgi:hypothetical protein
MLGANSNGYFDIARLGILPHTKYKPPVSSHIIASLQLERILFRRL